MTSLPERFATHFDSLGLPPVPAVIAVSGGADSIALLYLMAGLQQDRPLVVAHVDHGIHPDSGAIAGRVDRRARALGIPCLVARLELGSGASETVARAARYQALRAIARDRGGFILTAHHRDDQVETVLMRVFGGSGIAGLAGMGAQSAGLVRPLLPFPGAEIRAWVSGIGVEWWDDPANADPRHLRSWLRTEVLPGLEQRIPDLPDRILRLARWARQDRSAWNALLDLLPLDLRIDDRTVSLTHRALVTWPNPLGSQLLQAAARRAGWVLGPGAAGRVLELLRRGQSGQRADLGGGWVAELAFDRVVLGAVPAPALWEAWIGPPGGEQVLGSWKCTWREDAAPASQERNGLTGWFGLARYQVRPWREGDRILPLGGAGRRLVVRCMQDERVPRAERAGWPVVVQGDEIVWVPGVMRSHHALVVPGSPCLKLEFTRL